MRVLEWLVLVGVALGGVTAGAQVPAGESSSAEPGHPAQTQQKPEQPDVAEPHGKVLFSRGEDAAAVVERKGGGKEEQVAVTEEERSAPTFTAYGLDVHLVPARQEMTARVRMTVRNDGSGPLKRVAMQVSSALAWESFAEVRPEGVKAVAFVQQRVETDADHTGAANEAVVTLKEPLARGASVELLAMYDGQVTQSGTRLERIGAPAEQARASEWDQVGPETALRGYGNVLWYPVAGIPVFLGDGAKLFEAVGKTKLREQEAKVRLRLEVEYVGEAPVAAYFCGRRQTLEAVSENENVPVAEAPGVGTVEFAEQPLGFRGMSLFVTGRVMTPAAGGLVEAVTEDQAAVEAYGAAAQKVSPMLAEWLGREPERSLELLDLSPLDAVAQPFEDKALLATPMGRTEGEGSRAAEMAHVLSHSWFRSRYAWLDEGVAQLMSLEWMEQTQGREAAMSRLGEDARALALAEPAAGGKAAAGQSLVEASDEVYYRTKASAVLWMLRGIVGDDALKGALGDYRKTADGQKDFERVLEARAHQSLAWLFEDWVYQDKGLPDLTIVTVNPRQMEAVGDRQGGWLVAVEVRNDGDAVADVPVTVRAGALSGELTKTERLRIAGRSTASTRVVFEGTPEEVEVNDGSVPEVGASVHVKKIVAAASKP